MANEPLALSIEPEAPSEDDYRAFCAALSETARGRAFLAEYARRQRIADTGVLLASLERLEGLVRNQASPAAQPSADDMRQELLALLDGIRDIQSEIDAGGLTMQVAKLASLIQVVQQRIETIVALERDDSPADGLAAIREPEASAEGAPATAAAEGDGESAAQEAGPSTAIPEVAWFDAPSAEDAQPAAPAQPVERPPPTALAIAAVVEAAAVAASTAEADAPKFRVFKAGTIPPPPLFAGEDFSAEAEPADAPAPPPADPLAAITSLSEEERLALFT